MLDVKINFALHIKVISWKTKKQKYLTATCISTTFAKKIVTHSIEDIFESYLANVNITYDQSCNA